MPAAIPVTTPELFTLATPGDIDNQLPPPVALLKFVVSPAQIVVVPVMSAGSGFTIIDATDLQLVGSVYVITADPALPPNTTPDGDTAATELLLLLQLPPVLAFVKEVDEPEHTFSTPLIGAGKGFTVTVVERIQPVGKV